MFISNIIFTLSKNLFGRRENILFTVHVCVLIFLSILQTIAPPCTISDPYCAMNLTKGNGLKYEEGIIHSNPIHFHPRALYLSYLCLCKCSDCVILLFI